MIHKLISIIVPTKNSSATLEACLTSIKEQTYPNIEIILVDNFSTDGTPDIAKKFTKHVYSKGPERCTQRNYGVQKAFGEYVAIIDSDMNLAPTVIEECVSAVKKSGTVGVIIPEESFGRGYWAQCKKLERKMYVGVSYMEAARFFPKSIFLEAGGYDEAMVSGEDWDLSQRIEKLGKLGRTQSFIFHNEGQISLFKTIRKKYYYAQKFAKYQAKSEHTGKISSQTSIIGRYKLLFSKPKLLAEHPGYAIGMLFMKTCEFAFGGMGWLVAKRKQS